jgi:hypothetical protein
MEFDRPMDLEAVKNFLTFNDWLGYHPGGYGDWSLSPEAEAGTITGKVWVGWHWASCD